MDDIAHTQLSRRSALKFGLATGGALATFAATGSTIAFADPAPRRPALPRIADTSNTTPRVARVVREYFEAKSAHDAKRLATFYSNPDAFFMDAAFGFGAPDFASINGFFTQLFAAGLPPEAITYELRVVGDESGVVVEFIDTPEWFGFELRVLSSITFDNRLKILRAVDYWDGRTSQYPNTIGPGYATDFKDDRQRAGASIVAASQALQNALGAGDAGAAASLMTYDVILEDMPGRTYLRGRTVVERYLSRALNIVPYGSGATVAYVTGGRLGGGYEWHASPSAAPLRRGLTCLELDRAGMISRITTMYDSSVLSDSRYRSIVAVAGEPTP